MKHGRDREFGYFRWWLSFYLITGLGTALFRVLLDAILVPFSTEASSTQIAVIERWTGYVGALLISYIAFRAVLQKLQLPKQSK